MNTMNTSASTTGSSPRLGPDVIVLDGGMGDELRRKFPDTPWSPLALREQPDEIVASHVDYIKAGATVIETWNYSATPYWLNAQAELAGSNAEETLVLWEQLVRMSVRLAIRARKESGNGKVRIAGALPPLGATFDADHPTDPTTGRRADMVDIYTKMARFLKEEGVDVFLVETCPSTQFAYNAILACANAELPAHCELWVSFTLADAPDEETGVPLLWSGETLDAAVTCVKHGARRVDALLFNCCPPEVITQAIEAVRPTFHGRIGGYGNRRGARKAYSAERATEQATAGAAEHVFGERIELDPAGYADWMAHWVALGATIVGGCCGIGPDHIHAATGGFGAGKALQQCIPVAPAML